MMHDRQSCNVVSGSWFPNKNGCRHHSSSMDYDALIGFHWAIILLEEVLLSSVSQKSVAKNMADFHVCLRHLVPFGNGIYHWQTAILCFWRCLSPPWIFDKKCFCFELKMFFSYFACFTKSRKKCLSYPLVDAIQYAINEEYFLQVRCIF